ncbi:DinB family protein [Halobacillus sp. K22]|uniref:DinB family protein n=1 Tax=Halobacillus sp. K22 TaxID=3457431 RepID=UPI003FCC2CD3
MSKVEQFVNSFSPHRGALNDLIELIDEGNYAFKPTPTSMETDKLVNHTLKTTYTFARLAAKQSPEDLFPEGDETPLTERARVYTDETMSSIKQLDDGDLDNLIDVKEMFGSEIPAGKLLEMAKDHEIHHKGQLFVYVRAMGHTDLPSFVKK